MLGVRGLGFGSEFRVVGQWFGICNKVSGFIYFWHWDLMVTGP